MTTHHVDHKHFDFRVSGGVLEPYESAGRRESAPTTLRCTRIALGSSKLASNRGQGACKQIRSVDWINSIHVQHTPPHPVTSSDS